MRTESTPQTAEGEIRASRGHRRRHGSAARLSGVSSRLLTTMAIVRATAEDDRDYLSYIEPFVSDRLKAWPNGEVVDSETLSRALCEEFEFPAVPMHVSKVLIHRAAAREELAEVDHKFYANPAKLDCVPDLAEKKSAMLAQTNALAGAVVRYAKEIHELEWTEEQAYAALERLCEDFGSDLALARRHGLAAVPAVEADEALAVVHGFARRALERDATSFDAMVALVQGTMLANAVYFEDTRATVNRLSELRVYLDTTPLLRALGAAEPAVCDAAREMLALLQDFKVRMFVFPHVLEEMSAVLDGVAGALRRGRSGYHEQVRVGGRNREAIDALIKEGVNAGEIEAMIADLAPRLQDLGVSVQEPPAHVKKGHIDEVAFDKILSDVVRYKTKPPKETDLRSLAAVDRLRGGTHPQDLSQTRALFITTNGALVRAARQFFDAEGKGARVSHAMVDVALTSQLWVRSSNRKPEMPRRMLIADCYAALSPSPELWERWVGAISRLRERGDLTDEQVQTLIYHQQAKVVLFERTRGDPDAVSEDTVAEVLDGVERDLRRPAEDEADAARARAEAAEKERARLAGEVADLKAWKKEQEDAKESAAKRREALIRKARHIAGHVGAALAIVAVVILGLTGVIEGKVGWATVSVALVLIVAASWAWGTARPLRATMRNALFGAGAATALWVAVWGFVPSSTPATKAKPATVARHR
jgi:type IV secretory pathway VirB2 component (pilin)